MRVAFSMPGAAAEAIQIDEPSLFGAVGKFLDSQMVRKGRGWTCNVWADVEVAKGIRTALVDRLSMQGGEGFDDPSNWRPALRQAIVNIDAALKGVGICQR